MFSLRGVLFQFCIGVIGRRAGEPIAVAQPLEQVAIFAGFAAKWREFRLCGFAT